MTAFATRETRCRTMWNPVAAKSLLGALSIFCALGSIECDNCTIPAICSCTVEKDYTVASNSLPSQAAQSSSQNSFSLSAPFNVCQNGTIIGDPAIIPNVTLNCVFADPTSNNTATTPNATTGQFRLMLKYPCAIPIPPNASHGYSTGSVLLIILFTGLFSYLILGIAVNFFMMGARGMEVIPNLEFWRGLPSLVKDGAVFVQNGCRVPPAENYQRSPESYDAI